MVAAMINNHKIPNNYMTENSKFKEPIKIHRGPPAKSAKYMSQNQLKRSFKK